MASACMQPTTASSSMEATPASSASAHTTPLGFPVCDRSEGPAGILDPDPYRPVPGGHADRLLSNVRRCQARGADYDGCISRPAVTRSTLQGQVSRSLCLLGCGQYQRTVLEESACGATG